LWRAVFIPESKWLDNLAGYPAQSRSLSNTNERRGMTGKG
jgi:hypothetical protein